eukprot:TRINITY_DN819_c2_g1_i1.p1 TRINITY_DN819_c2_g1~~TRINITY_DN819_c2_g1_i1.p1  ORF type:complete len:655 (+),score=286.75 TRINITY_DN819_c2_g1_i1:82-2046(+)
MSSSQAWDISEEKDIMDDLDPFGEVSGGNNNDNSKEDYDDIADEEENMSDMIINKLSNLNSARHIVSQLDKRTQSMIRSLLASNEEFGYSVSPYKWDCPVQLVSTNFPSKKYKLEDDKKNVVSDNDNSNNNNNNSENPNTKKRLEIIIPSLSVDKEELQKIKGFMHYEERQLYTLLCLSDPNIHIIYLSSLPLHPSVVTYYLSLLPNDINVEERLTLFSTFDASLKPLSQKILERPLLVEKIKRAIEKNSKGVDEVIMKCFIPTKLEHKLAEILEVPIEASPSEVQFWGSKCGSRQIFKHCNIPHPLGCHHSIYDKENLAKEILKLWEAAPQCSRIVVKLNEGFSGEGNALLDMKAVGNRLYSSYKFLALPKIRSQSGNNMNFTEADKLDAILQEFPKLRFQAATETWETFELKISKLGCIVEEFIEGQGKQSPSLQAIIDLKGGIKVVSTHEQILGGADHQVYLGCRFPCDEGYRVEIHKQGKKIAQRLAELGAVGRFAVDFLCVPEKPWDFSKWDIWAIEINLRQGGTTHPNEAARLLTNGSYDEEDGHFVTEKGEEKFYIASDNIKSENYQGLLPSDLMTIIGKHDLLFDYETKTGVVFHLMGCLSQFGKVGATFIGNTIDECEDLYTRTVTVLDNECEQMINNKITLSLE